MFRLVVKISPFVEVVSNQKWQEQTRVKMKIKSWDFKITFNYLFSIKNIILEWKFIFLILNVASFWTSSLYFLGKKIRKKVNPNYLNQIERNPETKNKLPEFLKWNLVNNAWNPTKVQSK